MKLSTLVLLAGSFAGLLPRVAIAQDTPAPPTAPTVPMNAAEQAFAESMNNVKMIGFFTLGDSKE